MKNKGKKTLKAENAVRWDALSDFNLNCEVARALSYQTMMFFDVDSSICQGPVWSVPSGVIDDGTKVSRGDDFKPCNSWEEAGHIIHREGITIIKMLEGDWAAITRHVLDENGDGLPRCTHRDENPLKAAMIAYLKSKQ